MNIGRKNVNCFQSEKLRLSKVFLIGYFDHYKLEENHMREAFYTFGRNVVKQTLCLIFITLFIYKTLQIENNCFASIRIRQD